MWVAGFYVGRDSLARQIAANFSDDNYYLPVDSQQLTVRIVPLVPGEHATASLTTRDGEAAQFAHDLSSPVGLEHLATRLAEVYPLQFEVGASLTIPDEFYSVERQQYRADQVLDWLVAEADGTLFRTIGAMPNDIYKPGYNFLFGLAKLGGNSCVASCARMGGRVDNARLTPQQRWSGIASHELGHTLGLRHVEDTNSLMAYADSLE
jgi:predicted Zn-dependent protease